MAHERLSPRQKMIGMMYLILTAMLALNVSKEAVEAFKKVDKSLTLTISNYQLKNDLIYKEFDRAAAENPTKAGKFKTSAYEVKQRADEAYNFIQDLKIEIISKAERDPSLSIKGREVIIEEVKRIDDTNVPSEILIGASENGKANALKAVIDEYREFLIGVLEGKNPTAENALKTSLNTDNGRDPDGQPSRWENLTFQTLPLVAVVTILSKMQVDVRNAETEVLNNLYAQIDAASFKFNKIEAIVMPDANYIPLGSTYNAKVVLSATDTTLYPTITLNGGQVLDVDESGKGIYSVRPGSTGTKTWGGVVSLKAPDGSTRTYDFHSSYSVGEANVVVSPTAMNVMYLGIPNPIDVSVPGIGSDKIRIRVVNGTFTTGKVKNSKGENFRGNWAVKPSQAGQNVQIYVTADAGSGAKPAQYGPIDFRVKPLPKPEARFAGVSGGKITKNVALAQKGVFAVMPDFDFDLQYDVVSFSILYSDRLGDFEKASTSGSLTADQRDIINRLTMGKYLTIKDIKAKGPDGRINDLAPIILQIN
ncbi:MAG: gliding motility protein GldM [Bacteroidales bacterium]|nr:gliding motility protein GldM [Bacteroidales bacterium]